MAPADFKDKLLACLGGAWPDPSPLKPKVTKTSKEKGFRIETLSYEVEPDDRVPALLLVPEGVDEKHPAPGICIWHQHAGQWHLGKSEPAGLAGNPMHHTGAALARLGYVVLCPDALCFEERQHPKLKGGSFERYEFLRYVVNGKCMAWKNILDMHRAVDYLTSRPDVNSGRIGCYGHSMGSTHAWLIGPHEPRIKATVGNCCLPTYAGIHDERILHCFPNFVPGWLQFGDTPEMAGLIAPRALHLNLGETDKGSPIKYAKRGIKRIEQAYARQQASTQFSYFIEPDTGHVLSDEMWRRVRDFFAKKL
jgi:dienelactone hydrolase